MDINIIDSEFFSADLAPIKPIEITLDNGGEILEVDGSLGKDWYIDSTLSTTEEIKTQIADLVGSGTYKVWVIEQKDTADLDTAVLSTGVSTFAEGNILVVTNQETKQTTGYIYSKEYGWLAFTGNANAGNTLFENDILCAGNYTQVGNVTKSQSGTTTIPAKGKTVEEVMTAIFTQELQPSKSEPYINISFPQAGAKEVGTTVEPSYSVTLSPGSYTYGPLTGVQPTAWKITDSSGNSATVTSTTFPSFVVTDDTRYSITATVDHTQGAVALTNIGNESNPVVRIEAGSKARTSSTVTGYRKIFYGILNNLDALDSSSVRALADGGAVGSKKITVSVNGRAAKRIVVAIPAKSGKRITTVSKTDGLVTDITSAYTLTNTVSVDGCNNVGNYADYNIWTYQPATIDSAEVHEITIG